MLFAPLEGWRRVEVTDRRTKVDWARVVRKLVDEDYPDKDWIVLVMDNLNTHHPASLYEAFEPAEARRIAERLEIHYVLVMDNLNTHQEYQRPCTRREVSSRRKRGWRIAERLEIHYTPKPLATRLDRVAGSWLNMAEIELGVLARQCLNRRIPDQSVLRREVAAWQQQRNRDTIRVDWRFTTADARIKLKSLYTSIQN